MAAHSCHIDRICIKWVCYLPSIRFMFNIFPVRLAHFLSSIEVGGASQCCSGNVQTNGHNDPPSRHRFDYSIQRVLGFWKYPQLPYVELYCCRNYASAAMVQVDGWQKSQFSHAKKMAKLDHTGITYLSTRGFQATSTTNESWSHQLFKTWFNRRNCLRQCQDFNHGAGRYESHSKY